jgi:predicted MFS family arabinose efflux permease
VLLAVSAAAFVAGNLLFRRYADRDLRRPLRVLALAMAVTVAAFGTVRPTLAVSALLLAGSAFLGGGRTFLGNAFGLHVAPEQRVAVMSARAAANQFGYFVGAAVGGVALTVAGYDGLGIVLGLLFVAAAATLTPTAPAASASSEPRDLNGGFSPASCRLPPALSIPESKGHTC